MKRKKAARGTVPSSGCDDPEPLAWMRQTGPDTFEIKTAPSFRGPVGIVPAEYKQFFVTHSQDMIERIQREIALPGQEDTFFLFPADLIADLKKLKIPSNGWEPFRKLFERGCICGFMAGAFMVHMPEATAIRTALARGRKKGGAVNRRKAAPTHKAIRKRFRELRKTTPKKTVRYLRVAEEYGMSDRQVARIVDGID